MNKDAFEAARTFLEMKAQGGEAVTFEQVAHRMQQEERLVGEQRGWLWDAQL